VFFEVHCLRKGIHFKSFSVRMTFKKNQVKEKANLFFSLENHRVVGFGLDFLSSKMKRWTLCVGILLDKK